MKFENGSEEKELYIDVMRLSQAFWEPKNEQEYWNKLLEQTIKFSEKYSGDKKLKIMSKHLGLAVLNGIKEVYESEERKEIQ